MPAKCKLCCGILYQKSAAFNGFIDYFRHIFAYLNEKLAKMAGEQRLSEVDFLTKDFHVWPDLHGNRSPLADPTIKGMICGLTLSSSVENLAITYLGFVQALSVRQIFFGIRLMKLESEIH